MTDSITTTSSNNTTDNGDLERETFHIYILSFTYGLMVLVVIGHLIWRWQWRRKSLSRFKSHVPGDKAFWSKRIRERLIRDFEVIQSLSPDPRLIHDGCQPSMLGACKEGSTFPTHWYRMKAFDEAANFVSNNHHAIKEAPAPFSTTKILSLPKLLSQLQQLGYLYEGESQGAGENAGLVDKCCQMYNEARHKDGDFGEPEFKKFQSLLKQLQTLLSSRAMSTSQIRYKKGRSASQSSAQSYLGLKEEPQRIASVGSEIIIGYGRHQHLHEQLSQEPLIAAPADTAHLISSSSSSGEEPSAKPPAKATPAKSASHDTPSRSSLRKVPQLTIEMSPLILDMDSDTPTGGEEDPGSAGVFVMETPSGQAAPGYKPPETPV